MASFYQTPGQVYRVREWDGLEWLEYGFGTRAAGQWAHGALVLMRQVHSAVCLRVNRVPRQRPAGDALLTATPGLLLGVRTADCLPILVVDPGRRVVAAVHAGWRGTVAEVSLKTVAALAQNFASQPEDLQVAFGPGIGACCYEVGEEVARQFGVWLPELAEACGPVRLDLGHVNRLQLIQAGVPAASILSGAPCTVCTAGEFHSWRREGSKAGRMLSVIGIRPR